MFACWWLIELMSANRQVDRKIDRLTDRQTGKKTYRQAERHTDRQTDRQYPFLSQNWFVPPLPGQSSQRFINPRPNITRY